MSLLAILALLLPGPSAPPAPGLLGHKFAPIWSPSGTDIAFSHDFAHREQRFRSCLVRADGSGACTGPLVEGTISAFSARGDKVLFSAFEDGTENVYELRLADGTRRRLTDARAPLADRDAAWSHDGKAIAYVRIDRSTGARDLWRRNADGSEPTNLTASPDVQESVFPAVWSSDDAWILYSAVTDGRSRLFRIRADGSSREALSDGAFDEFRPSPSPDGARLAFLSNRKGSGDQRDNRLFVRDLAGGPARQVGDLCPLHGTLSWSPDGEHLTFNAFAGEFVEIFRIRADGTGLEPLTASPEQELLTVLRDDGIEAARGLFDEFRAQGREGELFVPQSMNALGYRFLQARDPERALTAFLFNVQTYPEDANAWDSLGDGYEATGERAKAIQSYRRALSLHPPSPVESHARERLRALGAADVEGG